MITSHTFLLCMLFRKGIIWSNYGDKWLTLAKMLIGMYLRSLLNTLRKIQQLISSILLDNKLNNLNFKISSLNNQKGSAEKEWQINQINNYNIHNLFLSNAQIYSSLNKINLLKCYILSKYKLLHQIIIISIRICLK